MNIFLDDSRCRESLLPFTLTRHAASIRIGILTIKEKWQQLVKGSVFTTEQNIPADAVVVTANIIPTPDNFGFLLKASEDKIAVMETDEIKLLQHPWHIFQNNDLSLRQDYKLLTKGRVSSPVSKTNKCIGPENIFFEEGVTAEHVFSNASTGPIYIGKNAQIMEGSLIRGPFALGENSTVKVGSKIYGSTTIGPDCIVAGEIKNTVIFGCTNKAHDGYLGDSVIGEWCNLGAGTSNSNVKNTGGEIKYFLGKTMNGIIAGKKGGLLMGDYSRAAINTSFNTGTVAGVCCNIFGDVSGRKYLPDFTWGNERYNFEKAVKDIAEWKKMKQRNISEEEITMLKKIYDLSE